MNATDCRRVMRRLGCGGVLLAASVASAYDSPVPQGQIPDHGYPWVETKQPDINTVFLWKFLSATDKKDEVSAVLDKGDLDAFLKDDKEAQEMVSPQKEDTGPRLQGDAKVVPAGRFRSGLAVEGTGYAEGDAGFPALITGERGFTLDFWFRSTVPAGDKPETLVSIIDREGKPLFTVTKKAPGRIALTLDGKEVAGVPCDGGTSQWHHLALSLQPPREIAPNFIVTLGVDGAKAVAPPDAAYKTLSRRIGNRLTIGGAPGETGFRGIVDEVRLSKGMRYLYAWNLSNQELERKPADLEMKSPFFKSGKVLTRFRFDGTLEPEVFAGNAWTGKQEAAQFQRGVQGQALDLSGIDKAGFSMNGFYILPEKDGAIEFWFRPLNWNNFYVGEYHGTDVKAQWLMTLTAKDSKYSYPTKDLEVIQGRAGRDADLYTHKIHPGAWTHVLIVLKDGGQSVYLNGKKQRLWQVGLVTQGHPYSQEPLQAWRKRTGGKDDGTWVLAFKPSATLVDELSVYSWPLTEEEAWNAYARWLPDAVAQLKPLPLFRVDFDYAAHSWDMKEKLIASLACLPVEGTTPTMADLELKGAGGESLFKVEKQPLDGTGSTTFGLKQALPFGRYPVTVRSRDASGKVLKEQTVDYVREKPEWLGNTLGKDRTVPKAWTPMAVNERKISLVGRTVELGANGLPAQIETISRSILAAPAAIRVTTSAGTAELTGAGPVFGEKAPDRTAWKTQLTGGGVSADLDAWMEFDGLLYCALTLKPASGAEVKLDELDVDFPMTTNSATQLLANGGGGDFRASWIAKFVPAGTGSVWNSLDKPYPAFCRANGVSNFMPHIWLGADEVGLYFGAENDKGWTVDGPNPAQEILHQNQAVVFRMNIIREPTVIPAEGRRFHFILLPTPAKPEPPDWRKQMIAGGVNFGSCDSFGGFDMKTDPADPGSGDSFLLEPRSWAHAAKMAPQGREKWGRSILYADASWPGPGPSFRDWNHDMWAGTGRIAWTPEFEDYAVWAVNEYLKRGLIDGIYWDDVSVGSTYSLASTAYEYAGSSNGRRVGFTSLAQRRASMRLWRLFEAAGKEPCIWAHMTVCYEVPLFSFCRYLSNGEFPDIGMFSKRDPFDFWSADTLRILGNGQKWGTGVSFLSTLPRTMPLGATSDQWSYPKKRAESGLFVTSDIMTFADGLDRKLDAERVFDGPVRPYPWWKSAEVLKVTAPTNAQALASVYALDGRAIVFLVNRDRASDHEMEVEVDLARLFPGAQAVVWRDLDPGLKAPEAVAASAAELGKVQAGAGLAEMSGQKGADDEADLKELLQTDSPEARASKRLVLRTEGNKALIVVRPRDYRVLDVRPEKK